MKHNIVPTDPDGPAKSRHPDQDSVPLLFSKNFEAKDQKDSQHHLAF
jgi:hypothetical protein